ncbi:MAG: oxidoreductase [Flavobacteriaceae bacterium]|nr:oxidoreductase [Flavobacteriaceae bacterium]
MTLKGFLMVFFSGILSLQSQQKITVSISNIHSAKHNYRAIEVLNDSTLWFANSAGQVGEITLSGRINFYTIADGLKNHFRAIGSSSKNLYALTIGSPARMYQFEKQNYTKPAMVVYTENDPKAFYDALIFFDDKNGMAMGDPTETCLSIIKTNDSGKTWRKIPCINLPPSFDGEAAFAASNTNIAHYGKSTWIATGGLKSRLFYTKNKGKSWQVFNTPIIQGKPTTGIYTVAFYNAKIGIICGGDYTDKSAKKNNKAITSDGGKTWTVVANNKLPGYISCVQYVPQTKGKALVAVSTEGVYLSKDGGLQWEQISKQGFYSIRFVNKHRAFLGGQGKLAVLKL